MAIQTCITCERCGESLSLDPDRLVVTAAQITTFVDAHSQHETWELALTIGVPQRQLASDPN
jgi:hypothetical protein